MVVSLNSRLESNEEEEEEEGTATMSAMSTLLAATWETSQIESCTERYSSELKNTCFTEMRSGSEEGSHLRLIVGCITQL